MDHLCYFCLVLLCFHAHLFVDALWSPVGKGLTSWLSFVMSNCDVVTFPLVSWVRCGAWLYRFLIFALLLCFTQKYKRSLYKQFIYSKTCLKRPLKKKTKIGFQDWLLLIAGQKYCRMLILQYFRPSLSYHLSLRSLFCLF